MRLALLLFCHFLLAKGLQTTVQVCTNKDCCKRFQGKSMTLVQTFYDLVPPTALEDVAIEPSGCLSNCGKGPNICIKAKGKDDHVVHGVLNAPNAAAELDLREGLSTHPTLLAAVNVMEKAELAQTTEEKLRFLDSVIRKLSQMEDLAQSAANAHAHCLRAQVHLDSSNYEQAKSDIHTAMQIQPDTIPLPKSAWRILADAEEASGDCLKAIEAPEEWAKSEPQFATKVSKEVARIRNQISN